jgi:hypothetical protein
MISGSHSSKYEDVLCDSLIEIDQHFTCAAAVTTFETSHKTIHLHTFFL